MRTSPLINALHRLSPLSLEPANGPVHGYPRQSRCDILQHDLIEVLDGVRDVCLAEGAVMVGYVPMKLEHF